VSAIYKPPCFCSVYFRPIGFFSMAVFLEVLVLHLAGTYLAYKQHETAYLCVN
jgi:hypothetical protein